MQENQPDIQPTESVGSNETEQHGPRPICAATLILMDSGVGLTIQPVEPTGENELERQPTTSDLRMMLAEAKEHIDRQGIIGAWFATMNAQQQAAQNAAMKAQIMSESGNNGRGPGASIKKLWRR